MSRRRRRANRQRKSPAELEIQAVAKPAEPVSYGQTEHDWWGVWLAGGVER